MIIAAGIILSSIFGMIAVGCAAIYEETKEAGQPMGNLGWLMILFMFLSIACAFCAGKFG